MLNALLILLHLLVYSVLYIIHSKRSVTVELLCQKSGQSVFIPIMNKTLISKCNFNQKHHFERLHCTK